MTNFTFEYSRVLAAAIGSDIEGNHDQDRFGPEPREDPIWKSLAKSGLRRLGLTPTRMARGILECGHRFIEPHLADLEWLYSKLADEESKTLLVLLTAYRALGHRRIKLPTNNQHHWKNLQIAQSLKVGGESLQTGFLNLALNRMNLSDIGYGIDFFFSPAGVVVDFIEQQYRCVTENGIIECKTGDFAIDAGGCWGDTALYFAHKTGPSGRVASFEFLPANLSIYRKNLAMNPHLAERISLHEQAVWSETGKELLVTPDGPGTRVLESPSDTTGLRVSTRRIDDLLADGTLPRIDFIKMDIEGAELQALKGSVGALRQFRPELAITVYHKFRDFWEIPNFLDRLGLGYRFYLRHFTIHAEETVLFARSELRS
jgi:FkbM family methyltransferase